MKDKSAKTLQKDKKKNIMPRDSNWVEENNCIPCITSLVERRKVLSFLPPASDPFFVSLPPVQYRVQNEFLGKLHLGHTWHNY